MATAAWTPPAPDAVHVPAPASVQDEHSFGNVDEVCPRSLHLDWTIDWEAKRIAGAVTHELEVLRDTEHATFDTSFLEVRGVRVDGAEVRAELGERRGTLGQPLRVPVGARRAGDAVRVEIAYATTPECTALGWLAKEQTRAKQTPFLYSQCQAIHARSLLPCMDTPARKVTYTARVRSAYPVLMSALQAAAPQAAEDATEYTFAQRVAIPTYLIAVVAGQLAFRALGERTGVYAEPPDADAVQWEFEADAERFLTQAERLVSPYSWTRYDSVVLPPSFPYGGMENANLTTLTPSLVSGDRSSTDVLLHELCHSWSGNLVSCVDWASFWLNEGWTVYLERLLLQKVHGDGAEGAAHRGFSYIIGRKALRDSLVQFAENPRFQRLVPEFRPGEDPDDAFSSIPYEKGSNFLLYLERVVGGLDVFVPYLRAYFREFSGRSLGTAQWKAHLLAYFASSPEISARLAAVDFDAWLYGEGLELPVPMEYDTTLANAAFALAARWAAVCRAASRDAAAESFAADDMAGWNANQVVVFLEQLHAGDPVPAFAAQWLDETYALNAARNPEVRHRFYEVALEAPDSPYAEPAAAWVCGGVCGVLLTRRSPPRGA